jgi:hypothetical protein
LVDQWQEWRGKKESDRAGRREVYRWITIEWKRR